MSRTISRGSPEGLCAELPGKPDEPEDLVHIVGWWQWLVGDVLRLVIPRALCGESMAVDPSQDALSEPAESHCPRCLAISGGRACKWVPGYDVEA